MGTTLVDNHLQFTGLLQVVFCAQAGCGMYLCFYGNQVDTQLTYTLHNTLMADYGRDIAVTMAMDELQTTVGYAMLDARACSVRMLRYTQLF